MGDGSGHGLLSRSEDLCFPFLGWSSNQLEANQPSQKNAKRGALIPADLSQAVAAPQVTAVTSGSPGWECLSWPCLHPRFLLLVGLGLVGSWSVYWE